MSRLPAAPLLSAFLGAFGVIVTAAAVPPNSPNDQKYDDYFKKYTARYFGDTADWRVFKGEQ